MTGRLLRQRESPTKKSDANASPIFHKQVSDDSVKMHVVAEGFKAWHRAMVKAG